MVIREATPADRDGIERLYRLLCPGEPVAVRAERLAETCPPLGARRVARGRDRGPPPSLPGGAAQGITPATSAPARTVPTTWKDPSFPSR